ncbi:MAG: c-type cytochrome [Sulfuricurvum sp.]|nr:c-type cytochrome [Sulfuricurvum sp.]MDD5386607.1 c-type cytochrome [Sulfuricurvum sp.]
MKIGGLLIIGLASLIASGYCAAKTTEKVSNIYKTRCANCHGVKANGVPKLQEQSGTSAEEAAARGMASQEKINIYGPALNTISKEDLVYKLKDLRSKDFDSKSYHSVMQKNLKHIEEREGKFSDEKMADYIYTTFGSSTK